MSDLPFEMIEHVLDFVKNPQDGRNLVTTCRDLQSHFFTNDLFISHRLNIDLNRAMQKIQTPIYKRGAKTFKKIKYINNTIEECIEKIIETSQKAKSQLTSHQRKVEKMKEWDLYLSDVEKEYGKELANVLSTHLFEKVEYSSVSKERMDYRYTFDAVMNVGLLTFHHYAYDEEGLNTSWGITMKDPSSTEEVQFADFEEDSLCLSHLDSVKKALKFNDQNIGKDLSQMITKELLIHAIVMALPWQFGNNCVFYDEQDVHIMEE